MLNRLLVLLLGLVLAVHGQTPPTASEIRKQAETAQLGGNFKKASDLYSKLIRLEPTASNYFKRASLAMRRRKYKSALNDLNKALELDEKYAKRVLPHIGRATMALGDCEAAVKSFQKLLAIVPNDKKALRSLPNAQQCISATRTGLNLLKQHQFHAARDQFSQALEVAPFSPTLLLYRSECNLALQDWQMVLVDTRNLLQDDKGNLDALAARAQAFEGMHDFPTALNHYKEGLRSDPGHKKIKTLYKALKKYTKRIASADRDMQSGRIEDAIESYRMAINMDPRRQTFAAELFYRICDGYLKIQRFKDAIQACTEAINRDPNNPQFFVRRGHARIDNGEFEEAVRDMQRGIDLDGGHEAHEGKQRADLELKKSKRKDYYKILGVKERASDKEIKKAWKKAARVYHPDMHKGEEAKAEAEKKFRDCAEAYEVLSDPEKRGKFDRGEDVFENQGGHGHHGHPHHFHHGGFPGGGGQQFHFNFG